MYNLANKLIENYKQMPNKVCLIQKDKKVSYKDLYNMVVNFKNYLEKRGIKEKQKVLVLVPMSVELYVTLLAVWSIGAIPCFMDAGFIKSGMKRNEFDDISSVIGTKKYIIYSNINKNLRRLKTKIDISKISTNKIAKELKVAKVHKDLPGILTYTSGTTGRPKIAARTHEFLANQARILENTINYEKQDIEISTIPIFTLSNINVGITTVIADGNFVSLAKSNPEKLINQIKKQDVNRIMSAPGILNVIIDYCIKNSIIIKSIKKIYTGGGAVFIDFIEKLKKVFPESEITTLYGSTEAEPIAELKVNDISEDNLDKIKNGFGILAGNIVGVEECKIIKIGRKEIGEISKEEFEKLQTNEIGEIVVTGSNVLKGYVGGIGDKENKFSVEGIIYHRTGDLGFIDDNGKLWLRGRIKEPYFNIEAALHAQFEIRKTAVFENNGKKVLVLEDNNINEKEIKEALTFTTIDEIKYVKKIPVDKRHNTKVDYNELKRILGIKG